ncbi:TetR/AcrR family transcriptional regulator [Pseudomonas sp. GX19020]|uniref:TetR/AcrR family transcriptional regulator n=1 Tax=Pseudomonas sp. GX19020 TaxID=2942277 RepID=UPI00201863AA|nr:TetR/AcrR family transcriptional regulator [Pseudomonas sp. GX19020]MCL4067675.1 TetR/AcrR family transcriptional regulator [Pseudomonas sp. GX19020]
MSLSPSPPARGRPATITRDRIADAGIAIGLNDLTIVGVAARLGVSHMGLYKHVRGLADLRSLVAEAAFLRWEFPRPGPEVPLASWLWDFATSIWRLVEAHPGIAPWLLRGDMITREMTEKIVAHQEELAGTRGLSFAQARWLMLTIAFHCVAVADTVLPARGSPAGRLQSGRLQSDRLQTGGSGGEGAEGIDPEHRDGIRALITGALAIIGEITSVPYPSEVTDRAGGR